MSLDISFVHNHFRLGRSVLIVPFCFYRCFPKNKDYLPLVLCHNWARYLRILRNRYLAWMNLRELVGWNGSFLRCKPIQGLVTLQSFVVLLSCSMVGLKGYSWLLFVATSLPLLTERSVLSFFQLVIPMPSSAVNIPCSWCLILEVGCRPWWHLFLVCCCQNLISDSYGYRYTLVKLSLVSPWTQMASRVYNVFGDATNLTYLRIALTTS